MISMNAYIRSCAEKVTRMRPADPVLGLALLVGMMAMGMGPAEAGGCSPPTEVHKTPGGETLNSVAEANGRFMAVGTGGLVLTSTDGSTWTTLNPGTTSELGDVVWAGDRWAVITVDGQLLTWTEAGGWVVAITFPFGLFRSIEWDGAKLFITFFEGISDSGMIRTTSDFVTVQSDTVSGAFTDGDVTDIDFREGALIMSVRCFDFFQSNCVYSADGFTLSSYPRVDSWSDSHSAATNGAIAFVSNAFEFQHTPEVGVQAWASYLHSEDTTRRSDMRDADWIGNLFYGVGNQGYLANSTDGLTWTELPSPTTATLKRIGAVTGGGFVGVGEDETIIISLGFNLSDLLPLWPHIQNVQSIVSAQNDCL